MFSSNINHTIYVYFLLQRESAGILPLTQGFFEEYDPTVLLRLFNVFSTAALRFGHTLIRDQFELLARGVAFQNQPEPVLTRDFFNPALFYEEIAAGGRLNSPYGLILRGLVGRLAQQIDGYVRYFTSARGDFEPQNIFSN